MSDQQVLVPGGQPEQKNSPNNEGRTTWVIIVCFVLGVVALLALNMN